MELHLASMENITCWAFRSLCQGITDSYTGIFSMQYLVRRSKAWREIDTFTSKERQWIQVATSKEQECREFMARLKRELLADSEKNNVFGVQLNLSCPSPNIIKIGQGPALIKRTVRTIALLNALLSQDNFKVSIKTRLGLNEFEVKQRKIFALLNEIEKIQNPNFSHVVIHFRHAKEPSYAEYNYEFLKEIAEYKIPIVINGGINSLRDYNNIIDSIKNKKNIIGIMIGRAALKNPDCFVQFSNTMNNNHLEERGLNKINQDFNELCKIHPPRNIYLEKIKEMCEWNKT
ncbi:hypothetical protein A3K73_06010 [Candidatus Pacearchaeota archaeon RBG_13_36_9]|nr:MAG: hypothetical protein A3K73_06010 [Candidatus Pacearchaeota archaeon RBG_13_36_9]